MATETAPLLSGIHGSVEMGSKDPLMVAGERLPYNDYSTIDWIHDMAKDTERFRRLQTSQGLRGYVAKLFDASSGWIVAGLVGVLTACVAYVVDVSTPVVSDWKLGYCKTNALLHREACCHEQIRAGEVECGAFHTWSVDYASRFIIYTAFAILFGIISSSLTMLTKGTVPGTPTDSKVSKAAGYGTDQPKEQPRSLYFAAGSGIPEIKTVLSGFVMPELLTFKVLTVKAVGAVFAVSTGMCLGKEGPFVHIATCVGSIVAQWLPKYRENGRALRHMLSVACAAGLGVAFGAPIGGVLFSYEEISTYFPRKVLWRAFFCSLCAVIILQELDPTGKGKLILFETTFDHAHSAFEYVLFIALGVVGGLFGGTFCNLNYLWSKWFRGFTLIKRNPVLEVGLVSLVTALLQFPNPLIRDAGEAVVRDLLVKCPTEAETSSLVCQYEAGEKRNGSYLILLLSGCLIKLVLTIITFGIKVPSGVIIPALSAGALFGRFVGLVTANSAPGVFAMVGAASFLAGISRMTVSLCVIMLELTGALEFVMPHMVAILVAKWVADALMRESVYDVAQTLLDHPFLDNDHSMQVVRRLNDHPSSMELIPPAGTMDEITVIVPASNRVPRRVLDIKLAQLLRRGLQDAGLVLVRDESHVLLGYIPQDELEVAMRELQSATSPEQQIRVYGSSESDEPPDKSLPRIVDSVPFSLHAIAPLEYTVEMFNSLGLRYLILTDAESNAVVGVVIKKRLIAYINDKNR